MISTILDVPGSDLDKRFPNTTPLEKTEELGFQHASSIYD